MSNSLPCIICILLYSGDSQSSALPVASNLPPTNSLEAPQAWNQYHFNQKHGSTDSTDGSHVGYTPSYGMSLKCRSVVIINTTHTLKPQPLFPKQCRCLFGGCTKLWNQLYYASLPNLHSLQFCLATYLRGAIKKFCNKVNILFHTWCHFLTYSHATSVHIFNFCCQLFMPWK